MRASFRCPCAKSHARPCIRLRSLRVKCMVGAQQQKPLVVVGSINADLVLKVECLPQPGETISASSLDFFPGGKGANQAAAAAKLGWPTILVGQLGSDSNAEALQEALAAAGVQLQHVRRVKGPSGTAVILLQSSGENSIVIVGGANQTAWELTSETQSVIAGAGAVLLQREIPEEVNAQVAQVAAAAGVPVLLDAGGVDAPLSDALLQHISTISPNETELQRLTGQQTETEQQVLAAATALQQHAAQLPKPPGGVSTAAAGQQLASGTSGAQQGFSGDQRLLRVLVKRGSSGSMMVAPDGGQEAMQTAVAAKRVVDTTGAGDCFNAAYMVGVLEGRTIPEAMRFAAAAASICVSRPGAMTSLPTRKELDELLSSLG